MSTSSSLSDPKAPPPGLSAPPDATAAAPDAVERAQARLAIDLEAVVDRWLAPTRALFRADLTTSLVRGRLHEYTRGLLHAFGLAQPNPWAVREIGRNLAETTDASSATLLALQSALRDAMLGGLPADLAAAVAPRLEELVTEVGWGFVQKAEARPTGVAPVAAGDAPGDRYALDGGWARQALWQHPDTILVFDLASSALVAGDESRCVALFGYTLDEFAALTQDQLVAPDAPDGDFELAMEVMAGRANSFERDTVLLHRDGHRLPLTVRVWLIRDAAGTPVHFAVAYRHRDEIPAGERTSRADQRFRFLAQMSHDPLLVVGPDRRVRYASPSTERSLGIGPDNAVGRELAALAVPADAATIDALIDRATESPRAHVGGEARLVRADGLWRWYDLSVTNLLDVPEVAGYTVQARDVTARRQLADALDREARIDALTGTLNRRGLLTALAHALGDAAADGSPPATSGNDPDPGSAGILFLDLDRFKAVNDELGHEAGDALLVATTRRLADALEATCTLGRLGGDEFVVVVPGATATRLHAIADRLAEALAAPVTLGGQEVSVRASIGMVLAGGPPAPPAELLRAADQALYQAKRRRDGRPVMAPAPAPGSPAADPPDPNGEVVNPGS